MIQLCIACWHMVHWCGPVVMDREMARVERGGDVLCSIYSMNSSEHCVCSVNNNMLDFCGKHY